MLLAFLPSLALAGSLTLDADKPVLVRVNGVPVAYDLRAHRASVNDLDDGVYAVLVTSVEGARLGEARVALSGDQAASLTLRGGTLDRLVSARASSGKGALSLALPAGWATDLSVELDGRPMQDPARGGVLDAGTHALRVRIGGALRFDGLLDVVPGQITRCAVGNTLYCELGPMSATSDDPGQREQRDHDPRAEGSAPPPPPSTDPVQVTFVLKDAFDLSNVYVDGRKVAEFRTNDKERSVTLVPGVHTVEIKSFTEFDTWAKGTLTVTPGEAIRVGFDEKTVEVYNRKGAWTPAN
jgi:hypothetical protein